MSLQDNKRIAKNTIFLYIRLLVVLIINLYTTRIVLNVLGIVDYGIYNVVYGFVTMFAFLNNSLANGTQRFYNFKIGEDKFTELPIVFSSSMLIQIALVSIVVILLETVGIWYINNKMVIPPERFDAAYWVFHCSVLSIVFVILQVPYSAAILAFERMNYYAIVSIVDALLKLLVVVILPFINADHLIAYGILSFLISLMNFVLYASYCKRKIKLATSFVNLKGSNILREMTSFSGWNIFGTFAYMIKDQGLNMLLNSFFGPVVNAARGISMQINSALQGFSSNIVVAIRPQLVQSYSAGNIQRVQNMMFSMSRMIFLMLFMLSLPLIIELPYILNIWLSGTIPQNTIIFTDLVLVNLIITNMNTPLSQVVHATGEMKNYQIGTCITICSILPISWIFLKLGHSATAVFVICIIISVINQIICLFLLKQIFPISIRQYAKEVFLPCLLLTIVSPIIPVIIHLTLPANLWRLFAVIIICIAIVSAFSYYFILTHSEKQLIRSFIINGVKKIKL